MGKKYAYMTVYYVNPLTNKKEYLIGQKKFMNKKDGYIGTNPLQFVFPGGNLMQNEKTSVGAKREFEEETGHNLKLLKAKRLKKIHKNKFADFFLAEISSDMQQTFNYSKEKVIAMGNYYEFDYFEWLSLEAIIDKVKLLPNMEAMLCEYLDFIKNNEILPGWINKHNHIKCYETFKKEKKIIPFKELVKNHILSRSFNDWFIEFVKKIDESEEKIEVI
ncbi:hypothetical protein CPAV1605_865 [seawater metagenome]|uniref:Nudix hydrolase domain-containing protein n=1 Tax=seawater metagenome TaxID=1561972 RepID=A0A5E8CME0_9ZZZZ